jgi:hypothetical protein
MALWRGTGEGVPAQQAKHAAPYADLHAALQQAQQAPAAAAALLEHPPSSIANDASAATAAVVATTSFSLDVHHHHQRQQQQQRQERVVAWKGYEQGIADAGSMHSRDPLYPMPLPHNLIKSGASANAAGPAGGKASTAHVSNPDGLNELALLLALMRADKLQVGLGIARVGGWGWGWGWVLRGGRRRVLWG